MTRHEFIERCAQLRLNAVALTNHGVIADNLVVVWALAARDILLLDGVEISTVFGDFVIYSPDLEFLATLHPVQAPVRRAQLPAQAAVVWVHPAAGGGMSGSSYYPGLEELVAPHIDAVEVFNGNWLDDRHVREAMSMARHLGLPEVGGSDAHDTDAVMRCATEIDVPNGRLESTADLVTAIRDGRVRPWRRDENGRRSRQ